MEFVIRNNVLVRYHSQAGKTHVLIPDGVTGIGAEAFSGCNGLTSITIPGSVTRIGKGAFAGCINLSDITVLIRRNVKLSGSRLFESENLKEIFIKPDCISKIGNTAGLIACNTMLGNMDNYLGYPRATLVAALKKRKKELSEWLVGNNSENIAIMLSLFKYSLDDLDRLLALAIEKNAMQCKAYVLEYKNNNYTKEEIEKERTRRIEIDLGIREPTVKDIKKYWKLKRSEEYPNKYEIYDYSGTDELVTIPSSISGTEVAVVGMFNNPNVRKIIISKGVQCINRLAFKGCRKLEEIVIPNSVTIISNGAFIRCDSLTDITIPDSVTSIGWMTFSGCSGLRSITISDSVTSIDKGVFNGCRRLTSITVSNGNKKYSSQDGILYNKKKNSLIRVPHAIKGKFVILDSVTGIGNSAFFGCSGLTSITIPDKVTSIGDSAFFGCSGLTSITLPNGVTSIGDSAFYGCSGLTSITLPNGVTSIGEKGFSGCSGIANITIPDSVTCIGNSAFNGSSGLTSITVSNGNKEYSSQDGILYNKKKDSLIRVPPTITGAFVILDSVTGIGDSAFYDCSGLTSITIPDKVTGIGDSAFYDCRGLTSITIPDKVTGIGDSAFFDCRGLTSITLPNSVTRIGDSAFYGCSGLTSITIPNSVTRIGNCAFRDCKGLTSITIPNSVTGLGREVFNKCYGITQINCIATAKPYIWSKEWQGDCKAKVVWGYKEQ